MTFMKDTAIVMEIAQWFLGDGVGQSWDHSLRECFGTMEIFCTCGSVICRILKFTELYTKQGKAHFTL